MYVGVYIRNIVLSFVTFTLTSLTYVQVFKYV